MPEQLRAKTSFAEMLSTRFCHDLAGPISAVSNGLDFLAADDTPEMRKQAMDLLTMSAQEAFSKLQVYRMAFGRAVHTNETDVSEIREILTRYFSQGKITLDWPEDAGFTPRVNNEVRQLIVSMVLLVAGQLVYGGTLSVRKDIGAQKRTISISGTNPRLKIDEEMDVILHGKGDGEFTPQNAPTYALRMAADLRDVQLKVQRTEHEVRIEATYG